MLSVLIVNWNTREHLMACLESIEKNPPTETYEVIVVDNASTDNSAEAVNKRFPSVKLVALGTNTGYAHGNNVAFAEASGDFLLTLNPDTEMFENSLQAALDVIRSHKKAGCLGAKLVYPDGTVQRSIRGFPSVAGIVGDVTGLGNKFPKSSLGSYRLPDFDYDTEQVAPQPMGTFLLFRREALAAIGDVRKPFDEQFPIFFNEVDLLLRLRNAGWFCLYTPRVKVVHHGGESTKQVRKSMIWESHRSLVRFLKKHSRGNLKQAAVVFLSGLIYAAAFVRAKGYDVGFKA